MQTNNFLKCIAVMLTASLLILSCQSQNEQKEKELLQKENELLKKENELLQKEKDQSPNLSDNKTTTSNNSPSTVPKLSVSINKLDLEKEFEKNQSKIEGAGRDCSTVNSFIGDLNSDGEIDGLIHFGCSIKGNMGNASAGSGLAIFINSNGTLIYLGTDENFDGFVPSKISSGLIYGEIFEYGPDDARCCPSIKTKVKLKLVNGNIVRAN